MAFPEQSVTLTVQQIEDLNRKLAKMRHDINNHMTVMITAAELVRYKPESATELMGFVLEQPPKISGSMKAFTAEFEQALGITRVK